MPPSPQRASRGTFSIPFVRARSMHCDRTTHRMRALTIVASLVVVLSCGSGTSNDTSNHETTPKGTGGNSTTSGAGGVSPLASGGNAPIACPTDCDDGFPCTLDTCAAGVCQHTIGPNDGATACPAGQFCTMQKGCAGAPACASNDGCITAWKDDACKANPRCDAASSVCIFDALDKDGDTHTPPICGGDDCNDGAPGIHPGADESCNGIDDDCDGATDEEIPGTLPLCDALHACTSGACTCKPENSCSGACVDLSTDPKNCGTCGITCVAGGACTSGKCACPSGMICGELFKALNTEPATIFAIHQGHIVMTRSGILVATPTSDPTKEEGLVWTGIVQEVVGDGDNLFFVGGINCTRTTSCRLVIGRIPFASSLDRSEPWSTPPELLASPGDFRDLLVHGDQAYWRYYASSSLILSAPKSATGATPTNVGALKCSALTGDADFLYCATDATSIGEGDGILYRLGYDGSNPTPLATSLSNPSHVVVSGGYAYWTDKGLERVALDGSSHTTVATWDTDYAVSRFIVDGNSIYYAAGGLKVMTTTGDNVREIGNLPGVMGYAIDATHIYWSETTGIYRATKQ